MALDWSDDLAEVGWQPFYEAFGFRRMTAAMANFENPAKPSKAA